MRERNENEAAQRCRDEFAEAEDMTLAATALRYESCSQGVDGVQ